MKFSLKFKKQPKKIKPIRKIFSYKHIYYLIYLLAVGALVYVGNFIFKNYYQTVTQAQEIVDLKKEVAEESIDINRVKKILAAIDQKTNSTEPIIDGIKNPFSTAAPSLPSPSTPVATTTTSTEKK